METASVYEVTLELRQEGSRPTFVGRFPYGASNTATVASRGRQRKERFAPRAFSFAVNDPTRDVHALIGHDFAKPLGSKLSGSLELSDADDALSFRILLPLPEDQPSWVVDFLAQHRAGLVGGVSPAFQVPPASAVATAERLIPEEGNPGVLIREIAQAVLFELSGVTRPAYPATELDLRAAGLYAPYEPDPRLRFALMAITVAQLAGAMRVGDGVTAPAEPVLGILTRALGVADAFIDLNAEDAPEAIKDEARVRMAAYLYDAPTAGQGERFANAWRNSGAAALVSRWVVRRAAESSTDSLT